jgi:glycosidase
METLNVQNESSYTDDFYGTTYEIFPYSFYDSDDDGIGDLNGITLQLDYLNDGDDETTDDLGINAIWLTPVCQAVSYHKYDITDYETIDADFGTLDDYDAFVEACHERGIKVIFDLVINHTSDQHPWFQAASDYLKSIGDGEPDASVCPYVDYYHFSKENQTGYNQLEGTDWYYESQFWSGMPDLNLDNEQVRAEITAIVSFWLDHGVDGFRLDAVTSYYTARDDYNIPFMTWLNDMVKGLKEDCYIVGEAWTDQATYSFYYESGIDSFFDFAFAGSNGVIAKTLKGSSTALDFGKAMAGEEKLYGSLNPDYINAPFYTNHDLDRSAGYYAGDDGTKTKLAEGLNLLMQGNAFLYYGEELGMKGSGKDENKRAPMYWSSDASAEGMCDGPTDMDEVEMKFDPYEEQKDDPASIYCFVREAIRLRNAFPALTHGTTVIDEDRSSEDTLVFTRSYEDETVTVVLNLSEEAAEIEKETGTLAGTLNTSTEEVTLKDGTLTVPAMTIAICTE